MPFLPSVRVGHIVLVRLPGLNPHIGIVLEGRTDGSALVAVGTSKDLAHRPRTPLNWSEAPADTWLWMAQPWLQGLGYFYGRFVREIPRCSGAAVACWADVVGEARPLATCLTLARMYVEFIKAEARRQGRA